MSDMQRYDKEIQINKPKLKIIQIYIIGAKLTKLWFDTTKYYAAIKVMYIRIYGSESFYNTFEITNENCREIDHNSTLKINTNKKKLPLYIGIWLYEHGE